MTISSPIAFVGVLAITVAAAARTHAADTIAVPAWDEEDVVQHAAGDAEALQVVQQLQKESGKPIVDETTLRIALFFVSLSAAVAGALLLAWRMLTNRQQQRDRNEWTQHLLLLGQHRDTPMPLANSAEDVAVPTVQFIPRQYPRTGRKPRRMPVATPIELGHQWKRAA